MSKDWERDLVSSGVSHHDSQEQTLEQFYLPVEGRARSPFRARASDLTLPIDDYVAGSAVPHAPVPFGYSSGSNMYDWIWTELATVILSAELVSLMRQSNLTGWAIYPVELRDACEEVLPAYVGLSVVGKTGPLDDSNIPVTSEKSRITGRPVPQRKGFFFDVSTWDGSDFFSPNNSPMIIVTARVRDILVKKKIKNVLFERITEAVRIGTTSIFPSK